MAFWRYKTVRVALILALALAWPTGSAAGPALKRLGLAIPPGPQEQALEGLARRGLSRGIISPKDLADILYHFNRHRLSRASGPMLFEVMEEGAAKGVPLSPLIDKVHEGLVKGVPPRLVTKALRKRLFALQNAGEIIGVLRAKRALRRRPRRARPFVVLSSYLEAGLSPKTLFTLAGSQEVESMPHMMHGARAIWRLKVAGLSEGEGLGLVRAALRQGCGPPGLNIVTHEVAKRLRAGMDSGAAVKQVTGELPRIRKYCERFRRHKRHMMRMHPRW